MSEPQTPDSPPRLFPWRLVALFFVFLLLLALAPAFVGEMQIAGALLSGWWFFLKRTLPQIHGNGGLLLMSLVCFSLVFIGGQWFCRLIWKNWRWGWTFCGLATLGLFFLVGMAVGGIVHQVGWIASSPESLFESQSRYFDDINNMRQLNGGLQQAALETHGEFSETRRRLWTEDYFFNHGMANKLRSRYHVLARIKPDGTVGSSIIFPRDQKRLLKVGFMGEDGDLKKADQLTEAPEKDREHLIAL